MTPFRIVRITLMLACIFGAGIATGRFTTPPPKSPAETPAQFSGSEGRVITPRLVTQYFNQKLNLSPKQQQAVLAEAQSFVREIALTEQATQERFDIFSRYYPRIRVLLRPDQHPSFDALVKSHEARMTEILNEARPKTGRSGQN